MPKTLKKTDIVLKIHLVISVIVVLPAALIYGFYPNLFLEIHFITVDENNFSKAIMGLYFGFSILWIFGVFKEKYLKPALLSNCIFMLGLGFGRLLSWILDGTPTYVYQFGVFAELLLGFYGLWVLNSKYSEKA